MIENRIRSSNAINLDFEDIRSAVRDNMERAAERATVTKKNLPYMRAIRAVCYTLCICTASVAITLTTGQFNIIFSDDRWTSPGKSEYVAESFDHFFAFATFQDPDVILNSNILTSKDKEIFRSYSEKYKSKYFIIYMGTKFETDYIFIYDWIGDGKFEFESNLFYSYANVLQDFENQSGEMLTDEFLTKASPLSSADRGISLVFMEKDNNYIPYFEAIINNKAYIVCKEVE